MADAGGAVPDMFAAGAIRTDSIAPVLVLANAGVPTAFANEIQSLTTTSGNLSSGTFTLTLGGQKTGALNFNATAAQIQTALQALSTVEAGNVTCAGGPIGGTDTPVLCTFVNTLGGVDVGAITVTDAGTLVGGTISVVEDTKGEEATHRGAPAGSFLQDITNGRLYYNTGNKSNPVWTRVPVV